MSTQALQALVKKVFGEEEIKRRFLSSPDSVLAEFDLTEQEKQAAQNVHAKLGLVTTNSQELEAALDATVDWLAPEL